MGIQRPGFQVDNISVGGTSVGTAEADEGWVFDGFSTTTGSEVQDFGNYYIAENRQYTNYDKSLKTGYNFGFADSKPNWVESYPYQDGLLITYWDTSQTDNNVGDHPGKGLILPVDAHPTFRHSYDGQLMRPRILSFDSTFGLTRTDPDHDPQGQHRHPHPSGTGCEGLRRSQGLLVRRGPAREHRQPRRATTSPGGSECRCRRPER